MLGYRATLFIKSFLVEKLSFNWSPFGDRLVIHIPDPWEAIFYISSIHTISNLAFPNVVLWNTVGLPWHRSLWTLSGYTGACYTRPWGQPQSTGIWPTAPLASTGGIFPVWSEKKNTIMRHNTLCHSPASLCSFLEFLLSIILHYLRLERFCSHCWIYVMVFFFQRSLLCCVARIKWLRCQKKKNGVYLLCPFL